MKNKLKNLILILLAVSCQFVVVHGSLAYFTKDTTTRNIITTGGVTIRVSEYADEEKTTPFPEEGVDGVMPTSSVTKIVELDNIGSSPAWVRIMVEKSVKLADGTEAQPDDSLIVLDIDDSAWTERDGWYYWNTALEPGDSTTPLFRHVSFAASIPDEYQHCTAEVSVIAQAVQTASNGGSALDALGWPETGEGGNGA